jgi:hypothetical protein
MPTNNQKQGLLTILYASLDKLPLPGILPGHIDQFPLNAEIRLYILHQQGGGGCQKALLFALNCGIFRIFLSCKSIKFNIMRVVFLIRNRQVIGSSPIVGSTFSIA